MPNNLLLDRKIFVSLIVIIMLILTAGGLIIKLNWPEEAHLFIDYLPAEVEFWFWQNKQGFSQRSLAVLTQLGLPGSIVKVLRDRREEIVVYREKGRWYKLEAKELNESTAPKREIKLWGGAGKEREMDVIGFLAKDYINNHLAGFGLLFRPNYSYYFTLKDGLSSLYFSLIPKTDTRVGSRSSSESGEQTSPKLQIGFPQDYSNPLLNKSYDFDPNIVLAVRLPDDDWLVNIAEIIKNNLRLYTAKHYPVIISTQLPDGTWLQERVIKPELFTWQEVEANTYQLRLNQAEVGKWQVADQLTEVESAVAAEYFYDRGLMVVALEKVNIDDIDFSEVSNFFYLNLEADEFLPLVEILGKSEALLWLQDLRIRSMMVYEKNSIVEGELSFNNS